MLRKPATQPAAVELQILHAPGEIGPATVRGIHDALVDQHDVRFTITQKIVQLMANKGLLIRGNAVRPMVFTPTMGRNDIQVGLLNDLLQRAFSGAIDKLVLQAVCSSDASDQELKNSNAFLKVLRGER